MRTVFCHGAWARQKAAPRASADDFFARGGFGTDPGTYPGAYRRVLQSGAQSGGGAAAKQGVRAEINGLGEIWLGDLDSNQD